MTLVEIIKEIGWSTTMNAMARLVPDDMPIVLIWGKGEDKQVLLKCDGKYSMEAMMLLADQTVSKKDK